MKMHQLDLTELNTLQSTILQSLSFTFCIFLNFISSAMRPTEDMHTASYCNSTRRKDTRTAVKTKLVHVNQLSFAQE